MPKLATYAPSSASYSSDDRSIEWLKPADLARDHTHFCIDQISESKTADDWGNLSWYLSIVLDNHPEDVKYMVKLRKNGGKRDTLLTGLQNLLKEAELQESTDRLIHGCIFVALPAQKKGQQPYIHLTTHDEPGCACGYDGPELTVSEDVPF